MKWHLNLASTIALISQPLIAQSNDGPYVRWLDAETIQSEAVCDSTYESVTQAISQSTQIQNPCNGQFVARLQTSMSIPSDTYVNVSKYMALSDVEGHYDELVDLLYKHGVINSRLQWNWGTGHLIFVGDSVDRGDQVTETLWFIYRLQTEALKMGGHVHYLLGNHDVFALEGDDRYLASKYQTTLKILDRPYKDLFARSTEFGRWFRAQNTMLKLDDSLFVHAGLHPDFPALGLSHSAVNHAIRAGLNDPTLEKSDANIKWLLGSKGPHWYRGYFKDELTLDEVRAPLKTLNVSRVIVGHTIVPETVSLHDGLVIGIDTAFSDAKKVSALLFEDGRYYRATLNEKIRFQP